MSQPGRLQAPSRGRLWLFRLTAMTLVPAALLLAAEAGLRLVGYGDEAAFLVPAPDPRHWTTNQEYGRRFFPRALARAPVPFLLPETKGDAYRIFVIGGSAARGTPDSAYSFGRVLAAQLEAGYPGARFEVANAAMTAINSHVALDVVRACARRDPDLFVVYLGNNEVVGPYGAGTVFGSFSPNLTAIRAAIAVKATRLGQLAAATIGGQSHQDAEWRGMEMFLDHRLAASDPRLLEVYEHFERNLEDMAAVAHRAGARTLLVTVATNLRDQPPFASLHRDGLSAGELERWQSLVAAGAEAAEAGDHAAALEPWRQAAGVDDRHAELHYRMGRSLLALGRTSEAREHLARARDLDALRFRADSGVNDAIRRVAASGRGTALLDAARLFAEGTGGVEPLPGRRLFHEHVHLRFEGNLRLAAAIYQGLEPLLPERIRQRATGVGLLAPAAVAQRLAYTPFDRWQLDRDILALVSRPPFAGQLDHDAELEGRRLALGRLERQLDDDAWRGAEARYRRGLENHPRDLEMRRRFATLLQSRGRHGDAAGHWRELLELLPAVDRWRAALATALADAGEGEQALAELERLERRAGDSAGLRVHRGTVLESLGRQAEAEAEYARALRLQPGHELASFNLATAALRQGEPERAAPRFRELLDRHADFAPGHHNLGRCLEELGRLDEAAASYRRAVDADPGLTSARNSLALALERQGRADEALAEYRVALAYEPGYALARFNLADLLLGLGRAAEAENQYRQGLELRPDNAQARANRALALEMLRRAEAKPR